MGLGVRDRVNGVRIQCKVLRVTLVSSRVTVRVKGG